MNESIWIYIGYLQHQDADMNIHIGSDMDSIYLLLLDRDTDILKKFRYVWLDYEKLVIYPSFKVDLFLTHLTFVNTLSQNRKKKKKKRTSA